ncbi:hypothetical protein E2C01_062284 [Portunus trituberculatus]|uniref:Uncharacterized protein n=1 Tax=Portunus trituberculatus TaxID=210409 RepID=A0A5B7HAI5_PORTR|nr:hypothetical protein [Portunus trituberculatus]
MWAAPIVATDGGKLHMRRLVPVVVVVVGGQLAKGTKSEKKAYWVASFLKGHMSYPKFRDRCLETSLPLHSWAMETMAMILPIRVE